MSLVKFTCFVVFAFIYSGHVFAQDDLLADVADGPLCKDGDERLVDLLETVSKTGESFAVKSEIEVATIRADSQHFQKLTHFILRDFKQNRWKTEEIGSYNDTPIARKCYFDGTKRWLLDDGIALQFGGTTGWRPAKEISGPFDPWAVWLFEPMYVSLSLEESVSEVLTGLECVLARNIGDELVCIYSRKSKEKNVTRVIQLSYRGKSSQPHKFKIYPSIVGAFNATSVLEASKKMKLEGELVWAKIGRSRDIWAIKQVKSKYHDDECDCEMRMENSWLLENDIPKDHFSDPRKPASPSLESLLFR